MKIIKTIYIEQGNTQSFFGTLNWAVQPEFKEIYKKISLSYRLILKKLIY